MKVEEDLVSDFEVKYIASNGIAEKTKAWLDCLFPVDPEFPGTIITSIYFDTDKLKYFQEKEASDHIKSKFRIRWYEDLKTGKPSDICFLEFKHKIGENRYKKRIKMQNEFSELDLDSNRFFQVLDELRLFEGNTLAPLYPSYAISYTRFRYIIPNTDIRLCIDYNIHIKKVNTSLVKKVVMPKYLSQCVFELKGETALLPKALYQLERFGFKKDAFSKYQRTHLELLH